ncbi:MAG: MASE1 domain-containing protein [Burkholderiales bacterium]|nr:MASE1 domain-containing protein [Burkholderiales bacterium]
MKTLRYLRDAAVFAPCYVVLDWASYIDPVGPFNITPWNPQAALAIVWIMLVGLAHVPVVLVTIILADTLVRGTPGGFAITATTAVVLVGGYAGIAWALKSRLADVDLRTTQQLTLFIAIVAAGAGVVGAAFAGMLSVAGLLGETAFSEAWTRFWIGDAIGILVTAPLLFAAADRARRTALLALCRRPEAILQAIVLVATVWLIFQGFPGVGSDPSRLFYLLFLPLIWIAVRFGLNGAILTTAIVQMGVVLGIHGGQQMSLPVVELQALLVALTLTGLFLGVMVDQRQRAEDGLRQTLRLAAAGEMAGAIAHEINQPLTAVTNYGRSAQMLLERDRAGPPQVQDIIRKILAETERAAEVVRRLRDFFRTGTTRLEVVGIDELMAAVGRITDSVRLGRDIALEIDRPPSLPKLFVDRLQIEVVLRNLIANAVESIVASGRQGGRILVRVQPHDAGHVRIVVADNGPGIPAAIRATMFEPFVSGRPTGMGLGLAVSRTIAQAHGGSLEAAAVAHGEFHLVLPCAQST